MTALLHTMVRPMTLRPDEHDIRQQDALRDLKRLEREGGLISGWLRPVADASDEDSGDPVVFWGRLIGRGLAVIAFAGLCVYLVLTHFR